MFGHRIVICGEGSELESRKSWLLRVIPCSIREVFVTALRDLCMLGSKVEFPQCFNFNVYPHSVRNSVSVDRLHDPRRSYHFVQTDQIQNARFSSACPDCID